ncbi:MAG TPA: hypothetical protein VEB21_17315 [Terriglobales bacterium]|nr:hypothetical protein [Terriglobales bacterium]
MSARVLRLLMTLVLATGLVRVAYAEQVQTVRIMRAVDCCADDCPSAKKSNPRRCCGIAPSGDDSLVVSQSAPAPTIDAWLIEVLTRPLSLSPPRDFSELLPTATGRAGPALFLLNRHLLI